MINTPEGKQFVREITLEYIRQNNLLRQEDSLKRPKDLIPAEINQIVEIENIISDCVEKRLNDFKSL